MQVLRWTNPGDARLARQWNHLANGAPFRRWEWLGAWWQHYGAQREPCVLAVYAKNGDLAGLAPWYLERGTAHGNVLRFLGSGQVCSDYLSVLTAPGCERAVGEALGEWLMSHGQGGSAGQGRGERPAAAAWDLIELTNVAAEDDCLLALHQRLRGAGCTVHRQPGQSCWRLALPTNWEQYLAGLSKPNRRRVRACEKRLQAADAVRRVATTPEELQVGWRILVELHQQRRQSLGEPGCFASAAFTQFLHRAAQLLLAAGSLRLSWIELQGRPAASLIALQGAGVTYAYQTGIASEFLPENPGWMIQSAAIKDAIAAGCTAFDLLRGDEPYKGRLGAEPVPMLDLRIVSPRLAPQLRHTAWVAGTAVKSALKTGLLATGLLR